MELLLNNLIKAIGWSIFHSLWQGAIIYGILLLIIVAIPKLQPRLKHNLSFGAICLLFICYCITFFSVFKFPAAIQIKDATSISLTTEYYLYMKSLPQQISGKTEQLFPYLVGIYGVGLLFQLFILSMGYKRVLDLKKAAHFAVPAEWKASFEKLVLQLNLRQHIGFYLSDKINVPLVVGYFKPIVLFPIGLATQLDMDQVEAILIHELSHIRRNDYLLNLIKTGIETLLFFNPFIWLSGKFINIEREHACDDLVLKFTGNPMTYAHALLKLEILKDKSAPTFSMAASGKNQHLYQRIKRITDMKTNYMNVRQQIFTVTLAIATVLSLAWIKPSKAEKTTTRISQQTRTEHIEVAGISINQAPNPAKPPIAPVPAMAPKAPSLSIPNPSAPPTPLAIPAPPAPLSTAKYNCQDTTKKKLKYSIITVDEKGNKKEYKSVNDMPENMRNEVINESFNSNFNTALNIQIDTIINSSIAFLKSPAWKKSIAEISTKANDMERYFNSKEWKKQQKEILKNAENIQKHAEEISKQAISHSKDWMKQQKDIHKHAEEINKRARDIELQRKAEAE